MIPAVLPRRREAFRESDLAVLSGRPRQVVELRLQGLSPSQIGAKLDISVKSVGVYTYFARRELRMVDARGMARRKPTPRTPAPAPPPAPPANDIVPDLDDAEVPGVVRAREQATVGPDGRIRAKTISGARLTRAERRLPSMAIYPEDVERPRTRGECEGGPRPCPFVSCAHHLYLDVNDATGAIKLNFPHLEVDELKESCSLDVADRGGITLEEVGDILNLTRERIRQIEVKGQERARAAGERRGLR